MEKVAFPLLNTYLDEGIVTWVVLLHSKHAKILTLQIIEYSIIIFYSMK